MKPTRLQPNVRPLPSDYAPVTTIVAIARRWRALGRHLAEYMQFYEARNTQFSQEI